MLTFKELIGLNKKNHLSSYYLNDALSQVLTFEMKTSAKLEPKAGQSGGQDGLNFDDQLVFLFYLLNQLWDCQFGQVYLSE